MNKFKTYIMSGFFSALIGVAVEVTAVLLRKQDFIDLNSLLKSMATGAIIGTVSLIVFLEIFLRLKQKPIVGLLSNFLVVGVLTLGDAVWNGIRTLPQYLTSRFFIVFIVAEVLSFLLVLVWVRQLIIYNQKLELKKASSQEIKDTHF